MVRGVLLFGLLLSSVANAEEVVLILSKTDVAHERVAVAFEQTLLRVRPATTIRKASVDTPGEGEASVVCAVGAKALELAHAQYPGWPTIAVLVDDAGQNGTSIRGDLPVELQLQALKRLLPAVKNVGVVYSAENAGTIARAERAAARVGIRLESRKVGSASELPSALEDLRTSIDLILGLQDNVVLTQRTAQHLLLFSVRSRIPFVGPSSAWAKAGALFAFEMDFKDLGVQSAELVARVLSGTSPSEIPTTPPRALAYSFNSKTAEHMKLTIADDIVKNAAQRF